MTVPSQAGRGGNKSKKKTREEENIRNINKESLIFVWFPLSFFVEQIQTPNSTQEVTNKSKSPLDLSLV